MLNIHYIQDITEKARVLVKPHDFSNARDRGLEISSLFLIKHASQKSAILKF